MVKEAIPLSFSLTADNGVTATGEGTMANTCIVVFSLHDSYGDGWNGNMLQVEFSDGTPTENLTISSGYEAEYEMTISISTTVSVSLIQGNYIGEISFEIGYLDGEYDFERAIYLIKRNTRHFAKRQLTWFKREREVQWIDKNEFDHNDELIMKEMLRIYGK